MRYWLVNLQSVSVEVGADAARFTIWARRAPTMAAGDIVVFLEPGKPRRFGRVGKIVRVDSTRSEPAEMLRTTIELAPLSELPPDLDLETMQYSLTIVRNTQNPTVHFRRAYRLLPTVDYHTLT